MSQPRIGVFARPTFPGHGCAICGKRTDDVLEVTFEGRTHIHAMAMCGQCRGLAVRALAEPAK